MESDIIRSNQINNFIYVIAKIKDELNFGFDFDNLI